MGGWAFQVEKRRVKTKRQVCEVRAFSQEQAIEFAQQMACWDEDPTVITHTEYVAREMA